MSVDAEGDPVPPVRRELHVLPEFVVELAKGGSFCVADRALPPDARVVPELTRWDPLGMRLTIVVESAEFADVAEEALSPRFERVAPEQF